MADALSCFSQSSQPKKEILRDKSFYILHYLQTSPTRVNIASLSFLGPALAADFSLLHQIFICETQVLL